MASIRRSYTLALNELHRLQSAREKATQSELSLALDLQLSPPPRRNDSNPIAAPPPAVNLAPPCAEPEGPPIVGRTLGLYDRRYDE